MKITSNTIQTYSRSVYRKEKSPVLIERDSDGPDSKNKYAHYGSEIYLDGQRIAGPGHVSFTKVQPQYIRDASKMHEVQKGVHTVQLKGNAGYEDMRIDCALRLWSCGVDVEIDQ